MNDKNKQQLDISFKNTIRNVLMYAILSIVLLASGIVSHWLILEFVALASALVTIIYVIYLVYLSILKIRLKK